MSRDQFVIRHGRDTEVHWADASGTPELVYGGEREKVSRAGVEWVGLDLGWGWWGWGQARAPVAHPPYPHTHQTPTAQAAGEGRYWCDQYVAWSKTGAYLLTYHRQGVALWGGPNFDKVARLAHHGVA